MNFRLDGEGIVKFARMRSYMPGQVNLNPPKRIGRLKELLQTQSPRICLVRGEGIGDVLMTTPLIHSLKTMFNTKVDITYATNTRYLEGALPKVLKYNPDLNKIIDREELDESDYELVINLHCPAIAYERKPNPPLNRVDIFAQHAGVPLIDKQVRYYPTHDEIEAGRCWLKDAHVKSIDKSIMVHIFSSASMRNLDITPMRDAVYKLAQTGYKIILLRHLSDPISDPLWESVPNIVRLNGDIRRLAGVLKNCNLLLCPDSSVMHVAGAMNIPTVAIFNHTDPRARINYYPETVALWPGQKLQCCPCWGQENCQMHWTCLKMLTSDMIVEACVNKINSRRK